MRLQELAAELHNEVLRLAVEELTDDEVKAARRIAFDAQRLYGLVYQHTPEAHGHDMGWGDVK